MDLSAFNLQGKVALITGGAHGIGFSIAEGMAKCGATVCFNCSSEASLEKGLATYKAAGIDAHGYVADVSDEDAVNAMVAKIKAEVGPVDILVNNAGLMKRVPMIEMSHADFMRVIDVHVGGAFNCSKAVLPDMIAKREGKIINICSMMSELGRETVSAYAAAKGALKMLTKNIASEYGVSPDARVSLPMSTVGFLPSSPAKTLAAALPIESASSLVKSLLAMPRTPSVPNNLPIPFSFVVKKNCVFPSIPV